MVESWLEGIMVPNERRKKFYVDWGVNPAYVGLLVTLASAILIWAGAVNTDREVFRSTFTQHSAEDKAIEKRVDRLESTLEDRLTRMDAKMDRLIEGQKRNR